MESLEISYRKRYESALVPAAARLEDFLRDHLESIPRIDRISTRPKSVLRFLAKAKKVDGGKPKYCDPLCQIQDQIGARIVTFYLDDVEVIAKEVEEYFHSIESQVVVPDKDSEFGYFGKHFVLLLPKDVLSADEPEIPNFFELQIKTLFQHAWSEANHDLGYKTDVNLSSDFRRKIAFTSAQAWGADSIFNDLQKEIGERKGEVNGDKQSN